MKKELKLTPEMLLWKKLGIVSCEMNFSCGGDSMNDYEFKFILGSGEEIENEELKDYFDEQVYKNVEFYVNSDGHYMGEAGIVYIELDEDDEDNPQFTYSKDAESEWSETFTGVDYFPLSDDYKKFIEDKVLSIVGGEDDEAINYKGDCILTDEEEEIAENLKKELHDFANEMEIDDAEGEASDWFRFTTNRVEDADDEDSEVTITDEGLMISVERTFYVYKPSED